MTCHGEGRFLRSVLEVGILRLCLSKGLDARGCQLLGCRGVMPWWRWGLNATIIYQQYGHLRIEAYSDVAYASDKGDCKSTIGFCAYIRGNLVTRRSSK